MFRGLRTALGVLAAFAFAVVSQAATPQLRAATFPSDGVTQVVSKAGVTVYYVDPGPNSDGIDARPIRLRYRDGHTEQIDTFDRSVEVGWSPRGEWLVLTNHIGSNVSDCLAITPAQSGARKQSLTSLIAGSDHLRVIARDLHQGDHVYVSCGRWISPSRVEVEVRGYGCNQAPCTPRSFDHALIYDLGSGRMSLAGERSHRAEVGRD